jgi:hypothetical protein
MAGMPKLDEAHLPAICDLLGATDTGLTRPKIGRHRPVCLPCPGRRKQLRVLISNLNTARL